MTDYTWNGAAGSYLDPAQWTPNDVPLYGGDDVATIRTGTVTLSDAEPNNITLVLGAAQAIPVSVLGEPTTFPPPPTLVLSNGALGPDMTLDAIGQATLRVDGYDTNYGQINVSPPDSTGDVRGLNLTVNIGAGSQLNQEGTIAVLSPQTVGYPGVSLAFTGSGTLNNDGQIYFGPGSLANFGGNASSPQQVTGSGTITVDHANVTLYGAAGTQTVDLLGGMLTTSATLAATIKDWNNDGSVAVDPFVRSVQFNQTSDGGGDLQLFDGTKQQVGDLHLLGSYATSDFSLNQNKSGFEVISVGGHAAPSA